MKTTLRNLIVLLLITTNFASGYSQCDAYFTFYEDSTVGTYGYQFIDSSNATGSISYSWDFGDGNTSTLQNPSHNYSSGGIYPVSLTISVAGCTSTYIDTVKAIDCLASLTVSTAISGYDASFTPSIVDPGYNYQYHFGDGSTSTNPSPTHTYVEGAYNPKLYVSLPSGDCFQAVNIDQVIIGCYNSIDYNFDSISSPLTFDFSSLNQDTSNTYNWDFGDGATGSGANVSHTYSSNGVYQVCLTTIGASCSTQVCLNVSVGSSTCSASINASQPDNGLVQFDAVYSGSPSATYSWSFGDGNSGSGSSVSHTYLTTGALSFTVNLTVNDSLCTTNATKYVSLAYSIGGQVLIGGTSASLAKVFLITFDSATNLLEAIDTVEMNIADTGIYSFGPLMYGSGEYRVKAALMPADPQYANYLPTYYDGELLWSDAQTIEDNSIWADINLIAGVNPGGPGFIGGDVTTGANKQEDPVEGAHVIVTDLSGNAIAYSITDENGSYAIDNLAYGTYLVQVEKWGKISTPAEITLNASNESVDALNFIELEESIQGEIASVLEETQLITAMYPNPTEDILNLVSTENTKATIYSVVGLSLIHI